MLCLVLYYQGTKKNVWLAMVGIDLLKFVDNLIKACFLGKRQSEATCYRTAQYKKFTQNRTATAHELAHQCSKFDITSVHMYTVATEYSVVMKYIALHLEEPPD